jgi:uncharacterized protein DUF6064
MPDWWSYGLSDFLLFSPRTYYRLLERHNEALWPGQILGVGLGVLIIWLLRYPSQRQGRTISAILAVLWAWVGWSFLWQRYATINWAVRYVVPAFALEALLLGWAGTIRGGLTFHPNWQASGIIGTSLLVLSLATYPMIAPLCGRHWQQAEIFGIAPDPTVLATLGLLVLAQGGHRWTLLIVPMLWCFMSGATLLAMGAPEAWLQLIAPFMTVAAFAWSRRRENLVSS